MEYISVGWLYGLGNSVEPPMEYISVGCSMEKVNTVSTHATLPLSTGSG